MIYKFMKDTFSANFPSQGFIQGTLEPEDLAPIKKEIDNGIISAPTSDVSDTI